MNRTADENSILGWSKRIGTVIGEVLIGRIVHSIRVEEEVIIVSGVMIIQSIHKREVAVNGVMVKDIDTVFSGPQRDVLFKLL